MAGSDGKTGPFVIHRDEYTLDSDGLLAENKLHSSGLNWSLLARASVLKGRPFGTRRQP